MPFTVEQFLHSIATYNQLVWPAQLVMSALAATVIVLLWRRHRGAFIVSTLAALWIWIGVIYHYRVFSAINPAAKLFSAAFVLQGALLLWLGVVRRSIHFDASRVDRRIGFALIAYALIVYPATSLLAGHRYPELPTFGLPCPTLIFTFGVFAFAAALPWQLFVIPTLWAVVGVSAAVDLGMLEDLALLPAALLAIGVRVARARVATRAPSLSSRRS
jgi:hypothetical protein